MLLQVAQSVGSSVHYAQLCHLTAHSSVTLLASLQQGSIASYYSAGEARCEPAPCAQTQRSARSLYMSFVKPSERTIRPGQEQPRQARVESQAGLA